MKRHWIWFPLIALALTVMVGCEEQTPDVTESTQAAAIQIPSDLAIDPSVLPPPRPAIDVSPDLSGGSLVINEQTLAKMAADGVPAGIIDALKGMPSKEYGNAKDFAEDVRGAAGDGADAHMERIMRNALVVELAAPVRAPEGQMSIAAREQAQQAQVMSGVEFGMVYFDYDKSNIKPEFEATIAANAKVLLDHADMRVTIEGHCDERGTNEYNLALGQRRAEAVRRALVAAGVPAGQLQTRSWGEEQPAELGHDEAAWAKNRRSVIAAQ